MGDDAGEKRGGFGRGRGRGRGYVVSLNIVMFNNSMIIT